MKSKCILITLAMSLQMNAYSQTASSPSQILSKLEAPALSKTLSADQRAAKMPALALIPSDASICISVQGFSKTVKDILDNPMIKGIMGQNQSAGAAIVSGVASVKDLTFAMGAGADKMNETPSIIPCKSLSKLVTRLRSDLKNLDFVLLYAYNGTGKTRLSMEFKNRDKKGAQDKRDTLYFNAYTEDLFLWDNDLENDSRRVLKLNSSSNFFNGFKELALEEKIFSYLQRYAEFGFKIDYEAWEVSFSKVVPNPAYNVYKQTPSPSIIQDNIKISRGEENIFVWCVFLAICELVIDEAEVYNWVKFIYIDDPISSLDDNNTIAVATDLSQLLQTGREKIKVIISSHHHLFFNVICNELKNKNSKRYFLHKNGSEGHTLRATDETPFFHHVALLSELKQVVETGNIKTYHFNMLRSILEKTATFFGYDDFSRCVHGVKDKLLYTRALNLLSHGKFSIYEPVDMVDDTKKLFTDVFNAFLEKYDFELTRILMEEKKD